MKRLHKILSLLTLLVLPITGAAQKVIVTWGGGEESLSESVVAPVGAVTDAFTLDNLYSSADMSGNYTVLKPLNNGEATYVTFSLTNDKSDFSYGDSNITEYSLVPAKVEFTAYANVDEQDVSEVYADVYLVRTTSTGTVLQEDLLQENLSISTDLENPTTYKRLLGTLTVAGGVSYSVRLKLKWGDTTVGETTEQGEIDTSQRATFSDGTYMIQDVNTGGYLGGGNDWGTQATILPQPEQFTFELETEGENSYKLSSYVYDGTGNQLGLSNWKRSAPAIFLNHTDAPLSFFFVPGAESGTYYIGFNDSNGQLTKDTDYYLVAGSLYGAVTYTTDISAASLFRIVTQDDLRTGGRSQENPVNVTGLIWNPTLSYLSESSYESGKYKYWTVDSYDGTGTTPTAEFGYNENTGTGGSTGEWANVLMVNHPSDGFNIYQKVRLKAGTYIFTGHGFYYYDGGSGEDNTVFYATPAGSDPVESSALINNLDGETGAVCASYSGWPPSYYAFADFQKDYYSVNVPFTVDQDDTEVTLGVKGAPHSGMWYCMGELNLTYYGIPAVDTSHECGDWCWTLTEPEEGDNEIHYDEDDGCFSYSASEGSLPAGTISHETLEGLPTGAYLVSIEVNATEKTDPLPVKEGDTDGRATFTDGGTYMLQALDSNSDGIGYVGGGYYWGTRAILLPQPQQFTFTAKSDNTYILSSYMYDSDDEVNTNANHLGITDVTSGAFWLCYEENDYCRHFFFIPESESGTYYYIGFTDNETDYYYLVATSLYEPVTCSTEKGDATLFRIVTQDNLRTEQEAASEGNPVDVTGLIWNPTLNCWSNSYDEYWTVNSYDGSGTAPTVQFGYRNGETAWANVAAVNSSADGLNVYQTVKLKAGIYTFTAHGFYYLNSGTAEKNNIVLYATPKVGSDGVSAMMSNYDSSATDAVSYKSWPGMSDAYQDFQEGYYPVSVTFTVDQDDTEVTLGVKGKPTDLGYWYCWGELNLTYYGPEAGITFLANGAHTTIDVDGEAKDDYVTYYVLCEVGEDGTLDISLDIPAEMETEYSSLSWKELSYTYLGSTATLTPATGPMNSTLEEKQQEAIDTYNSSRTTENYLAAKAAIEAAQASADYYASVATAVSALDDAGLDIWESKPSCSAYENSTLSDGEANDDLAAAQIEQTTMGSDMTYVLLYDYSGEWTSTQGSVETSGTTGEASVSGEGFSADEVVLSYCVSGLPTGYYTVSFYALESGTTESDEIAQVFAESGSNSVTQSISVVTSSDTSEAVLYTLTVKVVADDGEETGTLTLGIKNTESGGDYAYCRLVGLVFNNYERSVALSDVSIVCGIVSPDETEYQWTFNDGYVGNVRVQHRAAKWYGLREAGIEYGDDFSEEKDEDGVDQTTMVTIANDSTLQNTHLHVDTIYMQKGTSMTLSMSTKRDNYSRTPSYNRWFNYLNDRSYYCGGHKVDDGNRLNLLTPASTSMKAWRFENGYVTGCMNTQFTDNTVYTLNQVTFYYPTKEEFEKLQEESDFAWQTNDYYAVACDASLYTDFAEYEKSQGKATDFGYTTEEDDLPTYCEPTLAVRNVFYIIGLDTDQVGEDGKYKAPEDVPEEFSHYWDMLSNTDYQDEGTEYLEEYEIAVPSRRVSLNTNETVTLPMDARAFGIPGETEPGSLTVSLDNDNTSESIRDNLIVTTSKSGRSSSMSGTDRIIYYYVDASKNLWKVTDGSTATILVTKKVGDMTYNLIRYKLTFMDSCIPLTEQQVASLDGEYEGSDNAETVSKYWWGGMTNRSESYTTALSPIGSRTFDYDDSYNAKEVLLGQERNYPFPLGWEESGYAFYDGSKPDDVYTTASTLSAPKGSYLAVTDWGMYTIVDDYIGYWDVYNGYKKRPVSERKRGYFLYVDATETPGTLMNLDLQDICEGSQIIATAWVKCSGTNSSGYDDAAVLFTLSGVTNKGIQEPIYRQYSGQLQPTTYITKFPSTDNGDGDEYGIDPGGYGRGDETNEWFQIYLNFQTAGTKYDHYTLRIDNNCASSDGGDFYLDDVRVYVQQPTPAAQEVKPVETVGRAEVRLDLDYEAMLGRASVKERSKYEQGGGETVKVGFIMLDKVKYDEYLLQHPNEKAKAIQEAAIEFYTSDSYSDGSKYKTLDFFCYYEDNYTYDEDFDHNKYLWRPTENNGRDTLSVYLYTNASPYTPYLIVAETINDEGGDSGSDGYDYFAENIGTKCSIEAVFAVTDVTRVWINGELADATLTHCAGQVYHIAPTVTYKKTETVTDEDGNETTTTSLQPVSGVYYDFFYGTDDEFDDGTETSLAQALKNFRTEHPDAEGLEEVAEDDDTYTEANYETILSYEDKIAFHRQYLDITVPDATSASVGGIRLVIRPIETTIYDEENQEVTATSWDFLTVKMEISGSGPTTVYTGFGDIGDYPGDYMPALRIGKEQAEGVTSSENALTIELRDGASGLSLIADSLYLVDTNDPAYMYGDYAKYGMFQDDFDQYSLPISKVQSFLSDGGNNIQIYFDQDKYPFREGYYYAVVVHYKQDEETSESDDGDEASESQDDDETTENDDDDEGICYGVLPMEIKIVPEYLVWQGSDEGNWNKDDNWKMVEDGNSLTYGGEYKTRSGYVPMKFSKVVIPDGKAVELYIDGFTEEDSKWKWADYFGTDDSKKPTYVTQSPTANIMYDMMAYKEDESGEESGSSLSTGRYRVNICDQIHYEPGAMILHPELLEYDKAWTDVKIPSGSWTLVSTPLQGVVSGDWYTKVSGTETEPYFTDLTFTEKGETEGTEIVEDNSSEDGDKESETSADYNDREELMVFQRSWGKESTIIDSDTEDGGKSIPAYASTGWTSVYNDASVAQQAGEGFSIKAYGGSSDNLVFRFPKGDKNHTYKGSSSTTEDLSRTNAGKFLVSSDLAEEDDNGVMQYVEDGEVSVTLTPSTGDYAIVGNPFTAYLSLEAFLDGNSNVDSYWLESTYGPVVGDGGTTSWGKDDYSLEPYGAFFVKFKEESDGYTVNFTKDMQTLKSTDETGTTSFSIKAQGKGGMSGAAVAYDGDASDGYNSNEDAMLMEDDSWKKDDLPLVYTVAGDKAVSINRLRGLTVIPLGVFSNDDSEYTLTFTGVDFLGEPSLYDAEEDTETPLTEGYTLDMQGASHGRYFIKTSTDVTEEEDGLLNISAYSTDHRRVTVSSNAEIERVDVYSVSGMLQRRVFPNSVACTLDGIESGVAVVSIHTSEGSAIRKITVR